MEFVSEVLIERKVEEVSASTEDVLFAFRQMQPVLYAWLMSEQFRLLTEAERELLLFTALVLWSAIRAGGGGEDLVEEKQIGEREERNWALWEQTGGGAFRHRLDPFFEGYPQEDLLAYVEDSLLLSEEQKENELGVTPEGRPLLFISLKTLIDVLIGEAPA